MSAEWIAVDWGTTHLRAWIFEGENTPAHSLSSTDGMGSLDHDGFEPALLKLISPHLGDAPTPVICCGMVGARQGWIEAPYAKVPGSPPNARGAARLVAQDPRLDVRILPGMSQAKPADVMRGEETQIAGYLAAHPNFDGVLCLPGTHSKWAHISAGEVVSFRTFMTGEMFALLSKNSVLRHGMAGDGWDDAAFSAAVDDMISRPQSLGSDLFSLRAEGLLNGLSSDSARARLSGLLIGLELAAARPYWLGQAVALIGNDTLASRYAAALAGQGVVAQMLDADAMTLAGLCSAHKTLKEI
ncbi:2-keto-3-deoxy-galactonokinase [Sulfitobacter sp. SK012]|uniref:2-dehydro-3-deoxygalactonokinase n=1 Tax=Sulfitobacter sp. SK012 TaxID=1389005 RepID=UPI000E0B65CE|nr:2-dehydro-3-deoxygalactonokinase [Sulfitobacter sp. SK012]AXI44693.1 2-keto-3-deoxy-galactonokinase [Sulfitobacter sp. SK012]